MEIETETVKVDRHTIKSQFRKHDQSHQYIDLAPSNSQKARKQRKWLSSARNETKFWRTHYAIGIRSKLKDERMNYMITLLSDFHNLRNDFNEDRLFALINKLNIMDPKTGDVRQFPVRSRERNWIVHLGHTIPTIEAINAVCDVLPVTSPQKIVSIGCGAGLWEALLVGRGYSIECVDNNDSSLSDEDQTFLPVRSASVEDVNFGRSGPGYAVLMLVWPLSDPVRYDAFALQRFRGRYVVFVGDYRKPGIGSTAFRREINSVNKWNCLLSYPLPSCPNRGYFPFIAVYQRCEPKHKQKHPSVSSVPLSRSSVKISHVQLADFKVSKEAHRLKQKKKGVKKSKAAAMQGRRQGYR